MPLADAPQSNKQHAVPQNIMDVEFKLVGDLTMRQFSYLLILGFLSYFSYAIIPGIFKWPIVMTLGILALGLAFIPVQERGLDEWLVNFFRAINSPTERVWKKEPQIPTAFMYDNLDVVKQEMITLAPTSSRRKLEEYLKRDTEQSEEDPLDIPEKIYAMKVREAFPKVQVDRGVGVRLEEPPLEEYEISGEEPDIDTEEKVEAEENIESKEIEGSEETKKAIKVEESLEDKDTKSFQPTSQDEKKIPEEVKVSQKRPKTSPSRIIKSRSSYRKAYSRSSQPSGYKSYSGYSSVTPDMHSGRKFINLVPSSGGEIVLPIRGQRVLDTSESSQVKTDLEEKAKKLNDLLAKIRVEEGIPSKVSPKPVAVKEDASVVDKEAGEVVSTLKKQNEDLSSEIERLKGQIARNKSMSIETTGQEQLLKKLEAQKSEIASSYAELSNQVKDLRQKLQEKEDISTGDSFAEKINVQLPVLTTKTNVVSGVVRDSSGNFYSDYLLIIKNSRGDTVRAFKTNSLGQFLVSTPLQNGTYTVEVSPSNKTDLSFGIIPLEVKGEVIPTLEIVGK